MTTNGTSLERTAYWLIVACLGAVQLNLMAAQTLFGLAAVCWLILVVRDGGRPDLPRFFLPLGLYAGWTLVSAAFSSEPVKSFIDCKQLVLWLMVPIVARLARADRARQAIDVMIAVGAAGALVGIVQYAMFGYDNLSHRPVGMLSHYMTYSGVLMLVTCAAVARLLFVTREWVWPGIAVPALLVALAVTQARNAWVGMFVALGCLLAIRNWKLVIVAPLVAILFIVVAPAGLRTRAYSIVDRNDPANRDRIAMLSMGAAMVRDHPIFGVGPEMVQRVYADYRPSYAVNPTNPHLHNVPVQIAAERGLPALALWLWFVIAALRELAVQLRRRMAPPVAAAGIAAIVAMLTAGLFEYNFGDSEFLMLFLGLITLPFAASRAASGAPAVAPSGT